MRSNTNHMLDINAITTSSLITKRHITLPMQKNNYELTCYIPLERWNMRTWRKRDHLIPWVYSMFILCSSKLSF